MRPVPLQMEEEAILVPQRDTWPLTTATQDIFFQGVQAVHVCQVDNGQRAYLLVYVSIIFNYRYLRMVH